jgi:hypothetical protein
LLPLFPSRASSLQLVSQIVRRNDLEVSVTCHLPLMFTFLTFDSLVEQTNVSDQESIVSTSISPPSQKNKSSTTSSSPAHHALSHLNQKLEDHSLPTLGTCYRPLSLVIQTLQAATSNMRIFPTEVLPNSNFNLVHCRIELESLLT